MSILISGKPIVGPGNEIYIGSNGNFFSGRRDLGVKARNDVQVLTEEDFKLAYTTGMYYVISYDEYNTPSIKLYYITTDGYKFPIQGNDYIIPTPGPNGNWFINGEDTGYPALITKTTVNATLYAANWTAVQNVSNMYVQTVSQDGLKAGTTVDVSIDTTSDDLSLLAQYKEEFDSIITHQVKEGYIRVISYQPFTIDVPIIVSWSNNPECENNGAMIDDESLSKTTTWSSSQINERLSQLTSTQGKNLEFKWMGTQLGIRQQGYEDYQTKDLRGPVGLCGIDGSSVVGAEMDEHGHLILEIQDTGTEIDTTKMLTLESGVMTKQDLLTIQNNINRMSNDIATLKTGALREVYRFSESTGGNYTKVVTLSGCGDIQIFSTKFTGTIRIKIDSTVYIGTFSDLSTQSENNLITLSSENNKVMMNSVFATDQSYPLNIVFNGYVQIEILVDDNTENLYPSILIQGDYYSNGEYGEEAGPTLNIGTITDSDIDEMFDQLLDGDAADDASEYDSWAASLIEE